jgi:hypothetical protein
MRHQDLGPGYHAGGKVTDVGAPLVLPVSAPVVPAGPMTGPRIPDSQPPRVSVAVRIASSTASTSSSPLPSAAAASAASRFQEIHRWTQLPR